MDTTYIVVFQDGSKRSHSSNELDLSIYMKGGPVTIYSKEDFIAQFGQAEYDNEFGSEKEKTPSSTLMERMASAGEPEPVKKEEEPDPYKENVTDAIKQLKDVGDNVFSQALNLAMKGELNDFDEAFDEGEVVQFNQEDLENLKDPNVQKLMGLLNTIGDTMESLTNINGIKSDDLDF